MTVYEMEGFLRGKCVPGDLKVNETNAEYLVRKFAELENKCAALVTENARLKKFCKDAAFDALNDIKTPATDTFLTEVRASELDSLADVAKTMLVKFSNQSCSSDMHEVVGWKMVLQQANNRAAQHRTGVQS